MTASAFAAAIAALTAINITVWIDSLAPTAGNLQDILEITAFLTEIVAWSSTALAIASTVRMVSAIR